MTITSKKLYFARPVGPFDASDLVCSRVRASDRIRELGYTIVDPYTPLLRRLEARVGLPLESLSAAKIESALREVVGEVAQIDPYFELVQRQWTSEGGLVIDGAAALALASPEEAAKIHHADEKRVTECDLVIVDVAEDQGGPSLELESARSLGMLRFAVIAGAGRYEGDRDLFTAIYATIDELLPVLEVHNSGEGPYLTTSPVNKVKGDVLIYAIDMASLFPHILVKIASELRYPRRLFSFCCERSHVHELAQKIPVMLRLGGVVRLTVLSKDGSPHDVQMHTMVQEVVENVEYRGEVRHFVVEHGRLHAVSSAAVKASRHLHVTTGLLEREGTGSDSNETVGKSVGRRPCVGVIVGGQSDLPALERSGLRSRLEREEIDHTFEVISSDREPERLRQYCRANGHRWDVVIAIAGGVPNLPIAVMSWVRGTPVISVPVEERLDLAAATLTTPAEAPVIVTGYGERGLRKAGELVLQLLSWRARA